MPLATLMKSRGTIENPNPADDNCPSHPVSLQSVLANCQKGHLGSLLTKCTELQAGSLRKKNEQRDAEYSWQIVCLAKIRTLLIFKVKKTFEKIS